jgi:hypothetical protein
MPMARNRYDVVGKVRQRLDHDVLLNRRVVIASSPSVWCKTCRHRFFAERLV